MQFVWQFSCFPSIYLHTVFQYWVLITWCIYMFSSSSFLLCRFSAIASRDSQKVMVCNEGWQLWYFPLISLHTVWRIKIYQETCRSCIKSQQASIVVSLSDVIAPCMNSLFFDQSQSNSKCELIQGVRNIILKIHFLPLGLRKPKGYCNGHVYVCMYVSSVELAQLGNAPYSWYYITARLVRVQASYLVI